MLREYAISGDDREGLASGTPIQRRRGPCGAGGAAQSQRQRVGPDDPDEQHRNIRQGPSLTGMYTARLIRFRDQRQRWAPCFARARAAAAPSTYDLHHQRHSYSTRATRDKWFYYTGDDHCGTTFILYSTTRAYLYLSVLRMDMHRLHPRHGPLTVSCPTFQNIESPAGPVEHLF
nr:hypothetical protein CFP56_21771 [Quercus suber]